MLHPEKHRSSKDSMFLPQAQQWHNKKFSKINFSHCEDHNNIKHYLKRRKAAVFVSLLIKRFLLLPLQRPTQGSLQLKRLTLFYAAAEILSL